MNFLYKTIYTRDQPFFEWKVIGVFLFSLLFTSNVLLQFKSSSSAIGLIMVMGLPFIFISTGIYYYYKIFKLKELNPIDIMVLLCLILPLYNAITLNIVFDVKILKSLYNLSARIYIIMCSLMYYMMRTNKITIKQYVFANILLCWFCFFLYTYVSLAINPATFKDSLGDGLVGYNPSKGGYLYRFSSAFLIFGMIYYFLDYILKKNHVSLVLWLILMSYQLFIDKGRTELVSQVIPMFLFMFFVLKWHEIFKRLFTIVVLAGVVLLAAYFINPKIIEFTADMYIMFIKFFLGQKTGEGSADMRWTEMAHVYNYFLKHPNQIFFGVGVPKREIMLINIGDVVLSDIGIVGGVLSQGIIGVLLVYCLYLYPLYVWRKVKHYKNDIFFNTAILGCGTSFIQSLFQGAVFYSPFGLMLFMIIVEYYRVKEKLYWKAQAEKSAI
ncbi:MAG TPA: hypothetical protein PLA16_10355 [Chitinophagales bacterium]|nr:hypothetical protein [Chitinophagales bacterium]HQO31409.1 hypothetical protein [Chitinophagales bacterium]